MSSVEVNNDVVELEAPEIDVSDMNDVPPFHVNGIKRNGSVVITLSPKLLGPLAKLSLSYRDPKIETESEIPRKGRRQIFGALAGCLFGAARVVFEECPPERFGFEILD